MTDNFLDHLVKLGFQTGQDGKIILPSWAHRVKIDVGLSYTAVNSVEWIRNDPNLLVFGFEPLPQSVSRLKTWLLAQEDSESLLRQLMVLPVALGRKTGKSQLQITAGDTGSSSLLRPKKLLLEGSVSVDVFSIVDLLRLLPLDKIKRVDYLKLDCQGMDLDILEGADEGGGGGVWLKHIALITAEAENHAYYASHNDIRSLAEFLEARSFVHLNARSKFRVWAGRLFSKLGILRALKIRLPIKLPKELESSTLDVTTEDPTFVNKSFLKEVLSGEITGFQKD